MPSIPKIAEVSRSLVHEGNKALETKNSNTASYHQGFYQTETLPFGIHLAECAGWPCLGGYRSPLFFDLTCPAFHPSDLFDPPFLLPLFGESRPWKIEVLISPTPVKTVR
ncbi:hypothetical protein NPIL_668631 [Nephila pilipes]|uniref:Uncharacterized protein n=1 Tax=Nephila pilipes TaxID=299642 RepID=A0A8X6NVQ6_NEPPI|nr:hypothetical protein NPIL_668631 [Nephila pilipes]